MLKMVVRCVVPGCNNFGHHEIPKNSIRRGLWMKAMKLEGQNMKSKNKVCTIHFKESDYNETYYDPSHIITKRFLKRHAVPSIFPWTEAPPTKQFTFISQEEMSHSSSDSESETQNAESEDPLLKSTVDNSTAEKLSPEVPTSSSSELEIDNETEFTFNAVGVKKTYKIQNTPTHFTPELSSLVTDTTVADVTINDPLCLQESEKHLSSETNKYFNKIEIDIANTIEITDSVEVKQEENSSDDVEKCVTFTKTCESCGQLPFYSVHNYKKEPNGVNFYTGLETFDQLMFVFYSLGKDVNSLNYFYGHPPGHLDTLEQFCMTLLILKKHREFEDIAMMYKISIKQVANIFTTWIRFMYLQWQTIDLWIDRDAVSYYMLLDFSDKYTQTRVIIDETECPNKRPRLPKTQQIRFSLYKHDRSTVKLLIGIAPSGLITYISPCYSGSASDREIIDKSSILNRFKNDKIMVDKGLNVQDIDKGTPAFFKKGKLNPDILNSDRKIASKTVQVEHVIGMLKTYKILTQAMNETETTLSSEITFIVAMLVNFRSNIINK